MEGSIPSTAPMKNLEILHDWVIVEPYYDSEKIGSIFIPRSYQNPEAQQGRVIDSGSMSQWNEGDYVLFHPFRAEKFPFEGDYLYLRDKDIVASFIGNDLAPIADHAIIQPDWASKYAQKGLIFLPPTTQEEGYKPVLFGTVVFIYRDKWEWADPSIGDRVIIPPKKGDEIALESGVVYSIPLDEILAIIPK